ncbi:MAG TPA: glycogen-binding domain-containing protein [Verrucomicrobiae bacterium]|nr:glycogen-binding domain-containing protein [Verrucomicrobiae bacterium]
MDSTFQLESTIRTLDWDHRSSGGKAVAKRANADRTDKNGTQVFTYAAPAARGVQLMGDFTNWQERPIPLRRQSSGLWRAAVRLQPGRHRYRFVVEFPDGDEAAR